MTRDDVKELFKLIVFVYPNFEVNSEKLNTWTRLMSDQNKDKVFRKAEKYVKTNRFPPTIADLSERVDETRDNDFIRKAKKWEAEAVGKPN